MTKRIKKLRVQEVSAVPTPANQHAHIVLTKGWEPCDDCPSPKKCKKAGGCGIEAEDAMRKGIEAAGEARAVLLKGLDDDTDPAWEATDLAARGEIEKAAQMFSDLIEGEDERRILSGMFDKLYQSLWSIANDAEVPNKPAAVAKTVNQFVAYLDAKLSREGDEEEMEKESAASGGNAAGGSSLDKENGDMPTNKHAPDADFEALNKAHDETKAELAKAQEINKAMADRLEKLEKQAEEIALEKAVAEIAGDLPVDRAALRDVVKGLDEAGRKSLATILKAQGAQGRVSALFQTIGKSDVGEGEAASRIAKRFKAAGDDLRKKIA